MYARTLVSSAARRSYFRFSGHAYPSTRPTHAHPQPTHTRTHSFSLSTPHLPICLSFSSHNLTHKISRSPFHNIYISILYTHALIIYSFFFLFFFFFSESALPSTFLFLELFFFFFVELSSFFPSVAAGVEEEEDDADDEEDVCGSSDE